MENAVLYWLPNCSTCKKAKNFLEEKGIREIELRDVKEKPLNAIGGRRLSRAFGRRGRAFFAPRHQIPRTEIERARAFRKGNARFYDARNTRFKAPDSGLQSGKAIAGFFEKFWNRFLEENYYEPRK
jgi:hypothetical protein